MASGTTESGSGNDLSTEAGCCWGFLTSASSFGVIYGLTELAERIHEGTGSRGSEDAAELATLGLLAAWITWHSISTGMVWNLFVGFLAMGLGIASAGAPDQGFIFFPSDLWGWGAFIAFGFYLLSCLAVLQQRSPDIPFLLPLIVVGPLVIFSSWFWWDVFGVAGWGAVIAAVPLCGILALLAWQGDE